MKESTEIIGGASFAEINEGFMSVIKSDRDLIEKGKSAFVSFVRSYKEHKVPLIITLNSYNSFFNFKSSTWAR